MQNFFAVIGLMFSIGVGAWALSYLLVRFSTHKKKRLIPPEHTRLCIRAESGVYRSRFREVQEQGWCIDAPIQRETYVPLRIGEQVIVEATTDKGLMVFRSEVTARQQDPHGFVLAVPADVFLKNRRQEVRFDTDGCQVEVNEVKALMLNLSTQGAFLRLNQKAREGDRLTVRLPGEELPHHAWVLESKDDRARVRFEEAVDVERVKKRIAL